MRSQSRYELTLLLAVLLGLLLYVTGCQSDQAKLNAAEFGFTKAVTTLNALDDAGKIPAEWKPGIKAVRVPTYAAIQSYRKDSDAGVPFDKAAAWRAVQKAVVELNAYIVKAGGTP